MRVMPEADADASHAVTNVRAALTIAAHRHRVLLVHDDDDTREAMAVLLARHRMRVRATPDGVTALAALRAGFVPCVVLFDCLVLDMDAAAFRVEQARDCASRGIPTVLLPVPNSAERIESRGACHSTRWAINPWSLFATVDAHCRCGTSHGERARPM